MTSTKRLSTAGALLLLSALLLLGPSVAQQPPFHDTSYGFKDVMRESDPTAFTGLAYTEYAYRSMFDRRINRFETVPAWVFRASYNDRAPVEVAVAQEFRTQEAARQHANFYAMTLGRLPLFLRREVDFLSIYAGMKPFGGGRNVLIHTDQGNSYYKDGILEEILAHECAHALDTKWAKSATWMDAQRRDGRFISNYARDNPFREDVAESVNAYIAVYVRPGRITEQQKRTIMTTIPARLSFLHQQFASTRSLAAVNETEPVVADAVAAEPDAVESEPVAVEVTAS
ncbi:hypothetical protein P43SY_010316 [Pythium insidiosum]|uniref:Lipoprotein n=1 Tax=Pythium insidiosum TaxID=114742 RepID=A0AAD5LDM7_PYTIN|nr:hypothetical protein P43SY_010316 [Pythium insidiosum]